MQDPFVKGLKGFKANLHTHSTESDGVLCAEELCKRYRKAGYDILAITDHYKVIPTSKLNDHGLMLINSLEFHPSGPRGIMLHFVGLNVPENFENPSQLPYQEGIKKVRAAGGECILAHPYWCGLTSSEIMEIRDIIGIEVYNSTCKYINKAYSMQTWDELLDMGRMLNAVAVDDTHAAYEMFGGWTMIFAHDNTVTSILEALRQGRFYSSTGPEFYEISFHDRTFSVKCSPVKEIVFIGNGPHCSYLNADRNQNETVSGDGLVDSFEFKIPEESPNTYIRCQICDAHGRYAWTNPFSV